MNSVLNNPASYITIGENIHTTRSLLRKGKRIVSIRSCWKYWSAP